MNDGRGVRLARIPRKPPSEAFFMALSGILILGYRSAEG